MLRKVYTLGLAGLLFLVACSLPGRTETSALPGLSSTPVNLPTHNPVPTKTPTSTITPTPKPSHTPTDTPTFTPPATATPTATPPPVPVFSHIGIILLENREFGSVIGSPTMPYFNQLASENTLLTQHFAILHPSLPNYLALIGGETFGITANCIDCFINAPSLPDLLEASGRTWKTYQEDIPEPCFVGDSVDYFQKHNPFIYFDPIRLDAGRCQRGIVSLDEIHTDLKNKTLPDFFFITPNICNSAHDCELNISDIWLANLVPYLLADPEMRQNGLLIITWDEGQGDHGCCGIEPGGGRIATLLISPLARPGFQDATPYTHYALLKMIAAAWGLPELGHAADASTVLMTEPWLKK